MVRKGNYPQMADLSRFVKSCNLLIYIYMGKFDNDLTVLPHWNHGQ